MAQAMTPRAALQALDDLPHYEEALTAKAGGMTSMVWGLVSAGIFLTYVAASDALEVHEAYWGFALLWMPWVAAGITLTGAIWTSHAVSLNHDPKTKRGLGYALTLTAFFLLIAAALFFGLDVVAGVEWNIHSLMTVANGLFAVALGIHQRRRCLAGSGYVLSAGVAMVVCGAAVGLASLGDTSSGLLGATVAGTAWFTAGLVTFVKG